jgi:K+-sensing histidine kinase KdpD
LKYNYSGTKYIKIYKDVDDELNSFIAIQDNGRGITNEEFILLSKPYARKEGQEEAGTGLGLNISIAILKEHKFKVSAKKLEQGTEIKIKL